MNRTDGNRVQGRRSQKPCDAVSPVAIHLLIGSALILWSGSAMSQVMQTVPDAGRVLRESAPPAGQPSLPPPAPEALPVPPAATGASGRHAGGATFVLKGIDFTGNTVFDSAALAAAVADRIGATIDFAQLEAIAARLTARYREAGYLLAQVVVPAQEVANGRVTLSVVEGTLGKVRIESPAKVPIPESAVEAATAGMTPGQPLNQRQLERAMLLLSDLPGLAPQSSIESGNEPGTFDLIIELNAAPLVNFSIDLDSFGSRSTGIFRAGGFVRFNSPLGLGDNLDVRILSSLGTGLTFGRIGYELPLGYNGLRAGVAYSRVSYELGGNLSALEASGRADVAEATMTYPLIRSRSRNLFARLSYEHKTLDDDIASVQQASRKTLKNLGAGFVFENRDQLGGGGYSNLGATAYSGKLDIGSQREREFDQSSTGLRTNGRFVRVTYQATRLQSLTGATSLFIGLAGQWANNNLDSAEKIAVGGPTAVRAYSNSAGIGDEGQVVNLEYRWTFVPQATASVFYDIGHVRISHDPLPNTPNARTLRGAGLGLYWTIAGGLTARGSVAWRRSGADQAGENRSPRVYAQIAKAF